MKFPFVKYGLVCLLVAVFILKGFVPVLPLFSGLRCSAAGIEMPVEKHTNSSGDEAFEKLIEKEPVEQLFMNRLAHLTYAPHITLVCFTGLPGFWNVSLPVLTPPPDLVV